MSDMLRLEEQIAHLTRVVEELSDVVAKQQVDLDVAKRRIGMLLEREAQREQDGESSIPLADQRPPHW